MKLIPLFRITTLVFLITSSVLLISCKKEGSDNANVYEALKLGNDLWMKKNLDVSVYSNGDPIPQVTDMSTWQNVTTGAWTYYNNDPTLGSKYGKLYNWYAVNDSRGLAPKGWHVSTENDWWNLVTNLGGLTEASGKLKSTGTSDWKTPNIGATNSSQFSAFPGGRAGRPNFYDVGLYGFWWTPKESNATQAIIWTLFYDRSFIASGNDQKESFFSVRCVKD
jgi:uncharacterized protein (TIGR02145 family)